jgi:gliding motility-associated-like protein
MYQRSRTVYVLDTPTATFMADSAICETGNASVQYNGTASVNADYTWNFQGGTVISGTGAGPYSIHWNNPGMYTISLTVEENGCPSQPFQQVVEVHPELQAPAIQCFPTTSSATIQWSMVPNAIAYDAVPLFGPAGTVTGNQYSVTGLMPGDSIAIELTVTGNGECPPLVLVASCVAKNCPTPTITLTQVDDICLYPGTGSVDLEVSIVDGNGTGAWSGPGVTDVNQGIFNPVVAGPGAHTISYDYLDDGCSFVETITINVYDIPTSVISNTSLILTCENGNQLTLDGSTSFAPGAVTYLWTTTDGIFLGPTDGPTVTVGAPGDYSLLIVDGVSGCEDESTVTVDQDAGIPTADAGANGLINCNMSSVVLGGASTSGPSIEYLWTTTNGTIASDPTGSSVTVTAGGTYQLLVSDVANGCTAIDQVSVNVDTVHPATMLAVDEILDCDTESTGVSATVSPPGNYSYQWSTSNGQIQGGVSGASITAARAGIYNVIVINQDNGCADTTSVEVFADPEVISALETTADGPDCVGDLNGMIEIDAVVGGTPPYTYTWSNQASGTVQANLAPGTYSVTVADANGCTMTESFTLPAPQPINPDIGPNLRVNINETVTLNLSVTDSASIADVIWEGLAPNCPGCFQVQFTALMTGDVLVTVIDTNGCEATTMMHLTVYRPRHIFIPSVFSPNGDNINDVFRIQGNTILLVKSMRIFDRWGSTVYEAFDIDPNSSDGWDGTHGGTQLNPGVYVFMAELQHDDTDITEFVKGSVTLIR